VTYIKLPDWALSRMGEGNSDVHAAKVTNIGNSHTK